MTDKLDKPFPQRNPEHVSYAVLRGWWQGLEHDRGDRAALRRAGCLTEAMLSPAFHHLLHELRQTGCGIAESRYPKLAAIAGLAARVKKRNRGPPGHRHGEPQTGRQRARGGRTADAQPVGL